MKKCSKCGLTVKTGKFCSECGGKIIGEVEKAEKEVKTARSHKGIWIPIIVVVVLALFVVAGTNIKVPYTAMVTYTEKEPYTEQIINYKQVDEYTEEKKLLRGIYNEDLLGTGSFIPIKKGSYVEFEFNADGAVDYLISDNIDDCMYASRHGIDYNIKYLLRGFGVSGIKPKRAGPIDTDLVCFEIKKVDPTVNYVKLNKLELYEIKPIKTTKSVPYKETVTKYREVERQKEEIRYQTLFQSWGIN